MRRRIVIYSAAVAAAAGIIYAAAQGGSNPPVQASAPQRQPANQTTPAMAPAMAVMSQMGQMGIMMSAPLTALDRPLVRSLFGAFILPELHSELGLTSEQCAQLKQTKAELLARGDDFSRKIAAKEKEIDGLFSPDTSKGQQVKALLEQIADLRAQQHYSIYTAARKMKGALNEDQRRRLEAMKPEELRHAAMSHLTMEDFAQAMEFLRFAL